MAIIAGTTVDWTVSPRIVTFPVAETSVAVADIQDTLQDLEDSEEGIIWPHLRNLSGGEDLGGGVSVGLTMELQDAQLAFAPRTTSLESGTVTTANAAGTNLIDSTALFVTNGVAAGASIVNFTDQSVSTVIEVVSETELRCYTLGDGTDNDFDFGDVYKVFNETQCEASGGNVVAVDGVGSPISAIFPTFGTQVLKTSSSSATTQNQESLEAASYTGQEGLGVHIDPLNVTGNATTETAFPAGTRETPSLTEVSSDVVSDARGFRDKYILSNLTITQDHSDVGHVWVGDNPQTVTITIGDRITYPSKDVSGSKFQDCYIQGEFDANNIVWESIVGSVTDANGFIYKSTIVGPIVVGGTLSMEDCWTSTPGVDNVVDFNSTVNTVGITDWSGGTILVKNMVAGCVFGMGGTAGSLKLDSSCTGGSVNHGGAIRLKEDLSTGTTINDASTATQVWEKEVEGTWTAEEVIRIMSAALAGKASGLDTLTPTFRDINDTKDRITATTDSNGNRTAVTVVGS